jgi:hypothetical protein
MDLVNSMAASSGWPMRRSKPQCEGTVYPLLNRLRNCLVTREWPGWARARRFYSIIKAGQRCFTVFHAKVGTVLRSRRQGARSPLRSSQPWNSDRR